MLTDKSVRDLLAAFASPAPTPGGGSAAAAASAMGTALLVMVAGLPNAKSETPEGKEALAAAAGALTGLQQQLTEAIDMDTAAYDRVVAAYKMPKATPDEQETRKHAIQRALAGAIDVPLGVMRMSTLGLELSRTVARHGKKSAASDVGVAIALLSAGLEGARLNVEINLGSLADARHADAVRAEVTRLRGVAAGAAKEAASII